MSDMVNKFRAVLSGKRGETLMELIASILVFTVLVASVTMMIILSLRISGNSMDNADEWQAEANAVLAGDPASFGGSASPSSISLLINGQNCTIDIIMNRTDSFISFDPIP